jgi:hypothetical protein
MPDATDPLAPFVADVEAARLRLENARTPTAFNLALADYDEAKHTLRGAQQSVGATCLPA